MKIRLPKSLEAFVDRRIAAGDYRTREELIREALTLLKRRDEAIREVRAMVADGLASLDGGRGHEGDRAFFQAIKAEGRARVAARARRKSA